MYLTEMERERSFRPAAVETDMICRNCSAVISDDCEKCPSCGRKPDKREQNVNPAAIIILISVLLFLSCTAIAFRINRPSVRETTAPTGTTAFFVLEETTVTEAETQMRTETEKSPQETVRTEESTSDTVQTVPIIRYDMKTFDVTDSCGKTVSKRAVIRADKEDFQKNGKQNIDSVCKSFVAAGDYSWLTVDFGDSTGLVFLSGNASCASYGILDKSGLICELFGVIIINRDASYSYYPVSRTGSDESETANTEQTETQAASQITEAITVSEETENIIETQAQTQFSDSENPTTVGAATESDRTSSVVYITATGKKFHRAGCASLSKSKIEINRSEAMNEGYEPCKRCHP